jgi:hypothetical protein
MENWLQLYDHKYESYYYYNRVTGESQWENPCPPIKDMSTQVNMDEDDEYLTTDGSHDIQENTSDRSHSEEYFDDDVEDSFESKSWNNFEDEEEDNNNNNNDDECLSESYNYSTLRGQKKHDYLEYSKQYLVQRPFMDRHKRNVCVLCLNRDSIDIFFPCEHRCVCRYCIKSSNICEYSQKHSFDEKAKLTNSVSKVSVSCNCPLCGVIIQRILANEKGEETKKYWDWLYEIPTPLPPSFKRDFKHSKGIIESIYMKHDKKKSDSVVCIIS